MNEHQWDKLLKIKTSGRDDSHSDRYRYPYEPTPYKVLERLAATGLITRKNRLLDYGCGKGRVGFFLSWQTRCRNLGIEVDERLWSAALRNKDNAVSGTRTEFIRTGAEVFRVPADVDRIYFFNPFSTEILRKVMRKLTDSWYDDPREILLFFYYPSAEYISYLMTVGELYFMDEEDCGDLFEGEDRRERILIFRFNEGLI